MTSCEVCGGERFSLQDGFYNCDDCGTQSQEVREMLLGEDSTFGFHVRARVAQSPEEKDACRRTQPKSKCERVTLTVPERISLLVLCWIKPLQNRGAPADLKENALQLFNFVLNKIGKESYRSYLTSRGVLCWLWVALADCDYRYRLSDVLRWARDGTIPVFSEPNDIPADAKAICAKGGGLGAFTLKESAMFFSRSLRRLSLRAPRHPPLGSLVSRYLTELALPEQLGTVVSQLGRRLVDVDALTPEVDALALVLLALKLLVGLDGVTEVANARVAAARNAAVSEGPRWFDFSAWFQYLRQCRADVCARDYLSLQRGTGMDPCQQHHRHLLYDYFRDDGAFRHRVERSGMKLYSFQRQSFQAQTASLFSGQAPASSGSSLHNIPRDLLRPVLSQLSVERLQEACPLREATLDYLVDEKHARQLREVGLDVTVVQGAARRRQVYSTDRLPGDDLILTSEEDGPPPPATTSSNVCKVENTPENTDLRLYLPFNDVWAVEVEDDKSRGRQKYQYKNNTVNWPDTFRFLVKDFAQLVEMTERDFASRYSRVEPQVLGPGQGELVEQRSDGRQFIKRKAKESFSSSDDE